MATKNPFSESFYALPTHNYPQVKVQIKCFFIAEFERAAKVRKIAVYRSLIRLLVPEL